MEEGLADPRLYGEWFVLAWSREVAAGTLLARRLLGCDVVLWRSHEGIHCWRDLVSTAAQSFRWVDCAATAWCAPIMRGNTTPAASVY